MIKIWQQYPTFMKMKNQSIETTRTWNLPIGITIRHSVKTD